MGAWGSSFAAASLGDLATYEGRYSDAVRILEEGAAAISSAENVDSAAMKLTAAAPTRISQLVTALWRVPRPRELYATARFCRFGSLPRAFLSKPERLPEARTLAGGFTSEVTAEAQASGKILEGRIALKQGDARQAMKLLMEANAILDTWLGHFDLGRAFLEVRALPQADSEFDRCIQRRGEALALLDEESTYSYFPSVYLRGRVP